MKLSIIKMVLMVAIVSSWNMITASGSAAIPGGVAELLETDKVNVINKIFFSMRFPFSAILNGSVVVGSVLDGSGVDLSVTAKIVSKISLYVPKSRTEPGGGKMFQFDVVRREVKSESGQWEWFAKYDSNQDLEGVKESDLFSAIKDLDLALASTRWPGGRVRVYVPTSSGDHDWVYMEDTGSQSKRDGGEFTFTIPLKNPKAGCPAELDLRVDFLRFEPFMNKVVATRAQLNGDFLRETILKINDAVSKMIEEDPSTEGESC